MAKAGTKGNLAIQKSPIKSGIKTRHCFTIQRIRFQFKKAPSNRGLRQTQIADMQVFFEFKKAPSNRGLRRSAAISYGLNLPIQKSPIKSGIKTLFNIRVR